MISNHVQYDTSSHDDELVRTLYSIKSDPKFSSVRLAVITNARTSDSVLNRLAAFVHDVFLADSNTGNADVRQIGHQLEESDLHEVLNFYKPRADMLKAEKSGEYVLRQDYDELLGKTRKIINDENVKELVGSIINRNNESTKKLTSTNQMITNQNNTLAKLSDDEKELNQPRTTPASQ